MDNNFLITYDIEKNGTKTATHCWFETEEEMNDFIEIEQINPTDKIEILSCREIE